MSVQEQKLTAIADAIREKEGSTEPISAADFPMRILALETGGGGDFAVPLVVSVDAGAAVTAVNGENAVSGTADETGSVTLILTAPGEWTVTASLNGKEKSTAVTVGNGYEASIRMNSNLPEGVSLPDGYTELEYIENPNLGYIHNKNNLGLSSGAKFEIRIEDGVDGYLYGYYASDTYSSTKYKNMKALRVKAEDGNVTVTFTGGKTQSTSGNPATITTGGTITAPQGMIEIETDLNTYLTVNGQTKTFTLTNVGSGGTVLYPSLFAMSSRHKSSSSSPLTTASLPINCKLYSIRNLADELLYVPCIDPSGNVGVYNLKTNVFFASSTTAKPFVAGPTV